MYTYKFQTARQAQHMTDLLNSVYVEDITTQTDKIVRTTVAPQQFHWVQLNEGPLLNP